MQQFDRSLASNVASVMAADASWFARQDDPAAFVDALVLDGEIPALNVGIYLRELRRYDLALRLLGRIRDAYPRSELALYHSALNAAGILDHENAAAFAREAISRAPLQVDYRSVLVRAHAVAGRYEAARTALDAARARGAAERATLIEHAQFIDFCEAYPLAEAKRVLARLQAAGSYVAPAGVAAAVLEAVAEARPFSLVRLGDGEGAWVSFDACDEGRRASLYRANRQSFLMDWFGSARLIDDDDFIAFAGDLQRHLASHDIIGVPPPGRLDQEEGLLSMRGITTSVNAFRLLGLMNGRRDGLLLCSNSINLALQAETDFFPSLFAAAKRFGLITSQADLPGKLAEAGLDVAKTFLIPGDSRNFHRDRDGRIACQFPDHVARVDADLAALDLRGTVFLVGGGFVGKRYLRTIRDRGGIAFDLGALADHWASHGVPL